MQAPRQCRTGRQTTRTRLAFPPGRRPPPASTYRSTEIDLGLVTEPAKYYSLGLSLNGAGTTALSAAAIAEFLEPPHVS